MTNPNSTGSWDVDDAERYEAARRGLQAVIAAYSARVEHVDQDSAAQLRERQAAYAQQLRTLDPEDQATISAILDGYPGWVQQARTA